MDIHVVEHNETLWKIAEKHHTNVNQIARLNQLENPNSLVVGQALVIPDAELEYVVQPGDDLWSIANRLGLTIQELAQYNQITNPNLIYVGELLETPYFPHTIQLGEYLWAIAGRYGVTINELLQANNLESPSLIYPGQVIRIPRTKKPVIDVNAYVTQMNEASRQEVLALGRNFTYLSPFMYSFQEDGSLTWMQEGPILQAAEANDVSTLMVLTNYSVDSFNSDLGAVLLRNPDVQDSLISNILDVIHEKGYSGLNIDFEYLYPEDRQNYNNFLRRVVARLRPEGFSVSTALAPKEGANQQGLLYEAHDYPVHGELVDFVVLMTYEWGWAGGEPWAIAPINKVHDILEYAVTVIPNEKILLGMPSYGRDWKVPWVQGTYAQTVNPTQAVNLAIRYGADIQYDQTYQSPYFQYRDEDGQEHEVWFEDARSVQQKYNVVREYNLKGISYWVLGNHFPQNWPVLQSNFTIRKIGN
ncbi:LysM peptidoglycan-binding domain-containing protein [Ornithinibacillus halophilus]|uniref:Spore germination protein n=1 Tax=Ornithinibacillus halophilus TaxID=930117 RepID=A0A1M5DUQ4_9BACI|nr:LysM peptidoglycan-binding domain-containing protein [Ornithinibacillus halophilus]SHF70660.1 spore germination protein [Ornithinibacillus halophilus]